MQLQFCLVHRLQAGHRVPMHTHGVLELVYYVEGRGSSTLEGACHRVGRNIFTLTPAGVFHDQVNETNLTSICLGLQGSGLEARLGCYADEGGHLRRVCERLAVELDGKAPGFERVAEGLALQAAGLAERIAVQAATAPAVAGADRIVAQALSIIEDTAGAISVAELADKLYLSKDYLRHLFQEHGGTSPIRRIILTRIDRAKDLLADRTLSMQQIAAQTGFETVYYFSRMFKKETGATPTQYRAAL